MAEEELFLPDDCWEQVFKIFLNDGGDRRYLKYLSVFSKQFLSITNRLRHSLTVWDPTLPFVSSLLHRFPNLTSIDLTCFSGDLDAVLSQISCFPLKLTSLNLSNQPTIPTKGLRAFSQKITTITSLTCSNIADLNTSDFFLIADCFPLLEELDLSNPKYIKDACNYLNGIEAFSSTLLNLHKINLSFHRHINDLSLFRLFKNCKLLEEAIISKCSFITYAGIASAIRERPTLRYLSFSTNHETYLTSHFIDSLMSLKGLTCLDLSSLNISDELLFSIAIEGLPLKRLMLGHCTGYTYDGIRCLLSKCRCIQHLDLQNAKFLNNYNVDYLCLLLGNLESINLSHGKNLSEITLLTFVGRCPLLNEIYMEFTSIGEMGLDLENYSSLMDFVVNPQMKMKSLHLAANPWLNDKTIKLFATICPNLQLLDLSNCRCISEGIVEVLRCCKITHLNLTSCRTVNLHGMMNFEVPKLEVLNLSTTRTDDETKHST